MKIIMKIIKFFKNLFTCKKEKNTAPIIVPQPTPVVEPQPTPVVEVEKVTKPKRKIVKKPKIDLER